MKFNKQVAIILVLASLLLTALGIAYYFYNSGEEIKKKNNQLVTIFIAKDNIKKDTQITQEHIKKTTIAKQYVLTKPLIKKSIIGKYAKETIYKNEMFLKEKLAPKIVKTNDEKVLDYKNTSYNMSFKLFQNPNYAIEVGDWINIISVYSTSMNPEDKMSDLYSVQYVAKKIKVIGFLVDGHPSMKSIITKKVKKVVKKKTQIQTVEIKAKQLLLDIDPTVLLHLINDYNKGKQLWIVKTKKPSPKDDLKPKNETIKVVEDNKIKIIDIQAKKKEVKKKVQQKAKRKKYTKRYYPVKWYKTKDVTLTKTAIIEYADNPKNKIKTTAKIKTNYVQECSQRDKLLIGISRKLYIRYKPSMKAKVNKVLYKNYILPYRGTSTQNSDWYELCDGKYVHKNEVKPISFSGVLQYMDKQGKK
jgi:hypothetical protein